MATNRIRIIILTAVIASAAASIAIPSCAREQVTCVSDVKLTAVAESTVPTVAQYRDWHLVNEMPYALSLRMTTLCRALPGGFGHRVLMISPPSDAFANLNPELPSDTAENAEYLVLENELRLVHKSYIHVFANELARPAMYQKDEPRFPVGSIIVKEKWHSDHDPAPTLLTVMMKRETGFNPETGDWEYFTFDGSGTQLTSRGRIESCMECHVAKPSTDFVFRPYVEFKSESIRPGTPAE